VSSLSGRLEGGDFISKLMGRQPIGKEQQHWVSNVHEHGYLR